MTYEQDILDWRQTLEDNLRRDDSWLTLAGLYWLQEGQNTVGSNPDCDIVLPPNSEPGQVGVIDFHNGQATLRVTCAEPILIDGQPSRETILRDDHADGGPSLVVIRAITFYLIKRADQFGIRIRDANSPVRQTFTGRQWFPINPTYRVQAVFTPHPSMQTIPVMDVVGLVTPMENPGFVGFELHGQALRLEAFTADENRLWFIFKDATNGASTYGAGRFLTAPVTADGLVDLDFNRAYNPPCAFTQYATCPLPPKENVLPISIEAGERGAHLRAGKNMNSLNREVD